MISYYRKLTEKSYRDCQWRSELELSIANRILLSNYRAKATSMTLIPAEFVQDLYIFEDSEFNESFAIPTNILSTAKIGTQTFYLTQWGKLPAKDAMFEDSAPSHLIEKYNKEM
jgi:hypothetical protein